MKENLNLILNELRGLKEGQQELKDGHHELKHGQKVLQKDVSSIKDNKALDLSFVV